MTLKERVASLGYRLERNVTDAWGKRHAYGVYPDFPVGGGTTTYHDTAESVANRCKLVEKIRSWQSA